MNMQFQTGKQISLRAGWHIRLTVTFAASWWLSLEVLAAPLEFAYSHTIVPATQRLAHANPEPILTYHFFDRNGDGDEDIAYYYYVRAAHPRLSSTTYKGTILNVRGHLSNLYPVPFLSSSDSNVVYETPTWFDVDWDGDLDSIIEATNHIFWVEMQDGNEVAQHLITDNWYYMPMPSFADLDGDGDWDAWFQYKWYGAPDVCINVDGLGHVFERRALPGGFYHVEVAPYDVNGDQHLDFLYNAGGALGVVTNDTQNAYWPYRCDAVPVTSRPGLVLDLDGDGDLDFTVRGSLAWFENLDGNGHFSCPTIINTNQTEAVVFSDYDGDGDPDLVFSLPVQGGVYWHERLGGNPLFGPAQLLTPSTYADLVVADLNGDTLADIVGLSPDGSNILYHVQMPDGSLSPAYPVPFTNDLGGLQLKAIFAPQHGATALCGQPVAFGVDATRELYEYGWRTEVWQMTLLFLLNTNSATPAVDALVDGSPRQWPTGGAQSIRYVSSTGVPIGVPHVSRFVDLDGDGADDLLFGLGGEIRALLGESIGSMPLTFPYQCLGANEAVDLDNDGDLDLVITEPDTISNPSGGDQYVPSIEVAENLDGVSFAGGNMAGYPTPEPVLNPIVSGQGSLSGDFDGDGDVDIITLPDLDVFRNVSRLPPISEWWQWKQKYAVPRGETDADLDGSTAEQEYTFGGHPWFPTSISPGVTISQDMDGMPQLTIQQRRSTKVIYVLQSSSNLVQWLDVPNMGPALEIMDGEWSRATYFSTNGIQEILPGFLRVRSEIVE